MIEQEFLIVLIIQKIFLELEDCVLFCLYFVYLSDDIMRDTQ